MTEEELAAAIEAAVLAAIVASEEATTATADAISDGTVTYEENINVEVVLTGAEEALVLAESLIAAYYQLYGAFGLETLYALEEVESDLEALTENIETIAAVLAQGSEAASVAVEQLSAAAAAASIGAAQIQTETQVWHQTVQTEIENRAANATAIQPNQIADSRVEALQSALTYVETARLGLADGTVSPGELSEIAQMGANASASILAQGGPQLQNMAASINGVTTQIARGELPQAKSSLDALEAALPSRP
jgi:hypothetical protein